jgi:hypothetical protein
VDRLFLRHTQHFERDVHPGHPATRSGQRMRDPARANTKFQCVRAGAGHLRECAANLSRNLHRVSAYRIVAGRDSVE